MKEGEELEPAAGNERDDREFKGIYVTDGTQLRIDGFSIRVSDEGIEASHGGVSLRRDMCVPWLRIAVDHLLDAREANADLVEADEAGEDPDDPLHREFRSSMQAIVASAVALDAFYEAVKERSDISESLLRSWAKNRTARWKRMAEMFKRAFGLAQPKVEELRTILSEMSKFRGWAVHPPAHHEKPVRHPQIARGVEWRYMAFRYENAEAIGRMTLSIVTQLIEQPKEGWEALEDYCEPLTTSLEPVVERWREHFPDLKIGTEQSDE